MKTLIKTATTGTTGYNQQFTRYLVEITDNLKKLFKDCGTKCTVRSDCQYESRLLFSNSGVYLQEKKTVKNFDIKTDKLYFFADLPIDQPYYMPDGVISTVDKIHVLAMHLKVLQAKSDHIYLALNELNHIQIEGYSNAGGQFKYQYKTHKLIPLADRLNIKEYYEYKQMRLH